MLETWRTINYKGCEIDVSDAGNLRSTVRTRIHLGTPVVEGGTILVQAVTRTGYNVTKVSYYGATYNIPTHRAVALAFIPNPDNLPQVNHIDGDKTNNNVNNLEWCDNGGNQIHAIKTGLRSVRVSRSAHRTEFTHFAINANNEIVDIMVGSIEMRERGYDPRLIFKVVHGERKSHRGCTFVRVGCTREEGDINDIPEIFN